MDYQYFFVVQYMWPTLLLLTDRLPLEIHMMLTNTPSVVSWQPCFLSIIFLTLFKSKKHF